MPAAFLVLLGLLPRFDLGTNHPKSVLGGDMVMFGFSVSIQGYEFLRVLIFEHNEHSTIAAAQIAAGGFGWLTALLFNGLPTEIPNDALRMELSL